MLRRQDLKAVLSFVADAHDADGAEALDRELLDRLAALVGCEYATYETIDWARRTVTAYIPCSNEDPVAVPPPYYPASFWTSDTWLEKKRSAFHKLSDIHDRQERERLRSGTEFNAEFRVVDTVGFRVGDTQMRGASLHLASQRRDFDERDRELMLTLRPHVDALWRRSISRRQVAELAATLETNGDRAEGRAIVLFAAGGRIDHATPEARTLLAAWFGTTNGHLPEELYDWLTSAAPTARYTERRNGTVLTVEAPGDFTLILRKRAAHEAQLTPREREVLGLVAEGFTNVEIAKRLWVAPSTVAKHLEQAYSKLGVHSRTAAVACLAKLSD